MSLKTKITKRVAIKKEVKKYEDKLTQELAELIQTITHTGEKLLDLSDLKKIKNICKRSEKYVKEAFNMILEHLEENHAEVRISAFQLCDEIFRKSHCFREQVLFDFERIVKLTTGPGLPKPLSAACQLKRIALKTIHEWNLKFGDKYKKLSLAYNYLRQVEKVDFSSLDIVDAASQARLRENQRRLESINAVRIKKVLTEIKDKANDVKETATSLSNCINLLLPHPDDFFIPDDECDGSQTVRATMNTSTHVTTDRANEISDSDDECGDSGFREVGMVDAKHSIELDFTPSSEACIEETPENAAIIENALEYARLISNKYLPVVKVWLEVLSKSSGHDQELRNLKELKGDLDDVIFKYSRITFSWMDDVSSDSDLEEVLEPLEVKSSTAATRGEDATLWSIISKEGEDGDPTTVPCRPVIKKEPTNEPQASTSSQLEPDTLASKSETLDRKQKLLAVAPKLPFDVDLYHWEDEKLPVPVMIPNSAEGHRFWIASDSCLDALPVPEGAAALRTRVIEFTGRFTPVTHSCRVKLPSGKLCPRRDRVKCPFHGEIVPRDESGRCVNPEDAIRMQALLEKRQQERPDWQDPKLLADIKKATGVDLKMPEKGRRKKRKKEYPGLTDLKAIENTTTKRLERKIFKKSVMRKVANAMDRVDQRKFRDKFGDQFNYFYSS